MHDSDQQKEIDRVRSKIASAIIAFCNCNHMFHADDLRRFVGLVIDSKSAPASADRILRDLRKKGLVNYRVVNRHQSLYEVLPLDSSPEL
jgi:hypothetical protein